MRFSYLIIFTSIIISSCSSDDNPIPNATEKKSSFFEIKFDHRVGSQSLRLNTTADYQYETEGGEKFNVSKFGYYISNIILEGPNGFTFVDSMNASANANEVSGYYHIVEGDEDSKKITLEVPEGEYNKLRFTVGIPEGGVTEGAQGGVLDLANGAWFWTWNAGYISWMIEGTAESSPFVANDFLPNNAFAFHIGGWKNIEESNFVNNIKTVELDLFENFTANPVRKPSAHINFDILEVLDDVEIGGNTSVDFSNTFSVHNPKAGMPFANQLQSAFELDHVHP